MAKMISSVCREGHVFRLRRIRNVKAAKTAIARTNHQYPLVPISGMTSSLLDRLAATALVKRVQTPIGNGFDRGE